MKNFVVLYVFLMAVPLCSMDRLPADQRLKLRDHIKSFEFIFQHEPSFFGGMECAKGCLNRELDAIDEIVAAYPFVGVEVASMQRVIMAEAIAARKRGGECEESFFDPRKESQQTAGVISGDQECAIAGLFDGTLTESERLRVFDHIEQIESILNMGLDYFATPISDGRDRRDNCVAEQVAAIEEICKAHSIACPTEKQAMWRWLGVFRAAKKKCEARRAAEPKECDIAGLDKADVLKALFDSDADGHFWPSASMVTRADCVAALAEQRCNINYLGGRPLKVNLSGDRFDTFLYDRENGAGAARRVIEALRKKS